MHIIIYTKDNCPNCTTAKQLLANRWDPLQATSIAMGIDATVELVPLVSPESLAKAIKALS